jgi:hypothetical protein
MNDKFRFEIVRRGNGRFGWIFVKVDRGRRRVLARSVRDYGSPGKAEDAIDRMRGAPVDDTTVERDPFPLPATSFRIISGVVPLIVDEFDDDDASAFTVFTPRAAAVSTAEPKASPKPKKSPAKRRPARKSKPRRTTRRSAT